ncbi:SAM-dependent methyltransferase [Mycolicibacterium sp. PDY-3]|uniref:SAM-dependent methyltransferase n=1 Tax=Mycolicibacterium sp. PDY-3 TaxID=3376069 RepID=UPI0037B94FF1
MGRTDDDTWDLASSVGVTATVVAMQRAIATRTGVAQVHDPYAEPLVAAVGVPTYTRHARGEFDGDGPADALRMADGIAVRTRWFDEFVIDALGAGIRQFVILASGLDARAYRLPWPADATVFELDKSEVVDLKTRTLADLGAVPVARHEAIGVDLREDWPSALRRGGFDPGRPTAWLAEGLLIYLPPAAQDRLLDNVTALSAPGSRLATENMSTITAEELQAMSERMRATQQEWREQGLDLVEEVDVAELFYAGDRIAAATYLADRGWTVARHQSSELFVTYGLPPTSDASASFGDIVYVSAVLG